MLRGLSRLLILSLLSAFLYGCNLANSANDDKSKKNASASISIQSSSPVVNANGYYQEKSTVVINATGEGSKGSAITCVVTVSQKANSVTEYTDVDVINGCGNQTLGLLNGAGGYKIKLVVTDSNSKTAEAQTFAIVLPNNISDDTFLSANFTATPSVAAGSAFDIALDATSSTKGEAGDISTYTWQIRKKENDFVTNLVSVIGPINSPVTNVVVQSDGIYVVKLAIVDNGAKTASTVKTFTVSTGGGLLVADFSITIPAGAVPLNIQVDGSTSTVTNVDHYAWDLFASDALTTSIYHVESESAIANIPIVAAGIYLIRLRVIDATGNEHEVTRTFSVS